MNYKIILDNNLSHLNYPACKELKKYIISMALCKTIVTPCNICEVVTIVLHQALDIFYAIVFIPGRQMCSVPDQ